MPETLERMSYRSSYTTAVYEVQIWDAVIVGWIRLAILDDVTSMSEDEALDAFEHLEEDNPVSKLRLALLVNTLVTITVAQNSLV